MNFGEGFTRIGWVTLIGILLIMPILNKYNYTDIVSFFDSFEGLIKSAIIGVSIGMLSVVVNWVWTGFFPTEDQ